MALCWRAYSTNSFGVFTGSLSCTAISSAPEGNIVTGARSLSGLKGSLRYSTRAAQTVVEMVTRKVWPSGGDFATKSAAIVPLAPVRFSTTTGWPNLRDRNSPYWREKLSVRPPVAVPTTMRIGLEGQAAWPIAKRGSAAVVPAAAAAPSRRRRPMAGPSVGDASVRGPTGVSGVGGVVAWVMVGDLLQVGR